MTTAPEQATAKGWTADDSSFGARLALIRQRMAWGNVREAAIECGVPPESWRTWERDGVLPRRVVEISKLISNRTGCDYAWLVMGPEGRSTQGYAPPVVHPIETTRRPRDNRPAGRVPAASRRTGYIDRPGHPRRGR